MSKACDDITEKEQESDVPDEENDEVIAINAFQ